MGTESIQTASKTISKYYEPHSLDLSLKNSSGGALVHGQEVYLTATNGVTGRSTGAQYPIGVVTVGGADGEYVTVATTFQRDMKVLAGAGGLTLGAFVKPTGVIGSEGRPTYVVAVAGNYASGICLQAATATNEARIALLRTPIQIPA